jgi:tryptophan-rich sensory protein
MVLRIIIFLVINFAALGIGRYFTGIGVSSEWYAELNKAPWTPPGWVFGAAWTTIMICFSIYMASLWTSADGKKLIIGLFVLQWILNVSWNPVFFQFQQTGLGLVLITLLTILVGFFMIFYWPALKIKSVLILPYLIWLVIATSLNGYIYFKN